MSDPFVNRVYSLQISGYDDSLQKLQAMSDAFTKLDADKKTLNATLKEKITSNDTTEVEQLTNRVKDLEKEIENLVKNYKTVAKETLANNTSAKDGANAYTLLSNSYKDAVANARLLAAQFGVESKEALEAAASAAAYKEQLDAINASIKSGGAASPLNNNTQVEQLKAEKVAVDNLEGSYNLLKAQRKELEAFTASGNQTSVFTTANGQTFNQTSAIEQIKELKIQEAEYTDSLKIEKTVHEQIIAAQEGSINQIKQQRLQLQSLIKDSSPGSNISFQGNTFNYDEAIAKAKELQTAETELSSVFKIQKQQIETLPGSYYALLDAQKQAIAAYRQTPSDSPFFAEIKEQAAAAAAQVQAFNRTLMSDGTLVGEYKSGIINAFKQLGLGDLLKSQSDEITGSLNKLKAESQSLASQLKETGAVGSKSFQEIEQQLRVNIETQDKLKANLSSLDTALTGTGGVGEQITKSIASGFENAGRQIKTLVAGYIGFQALFSGFSGLISENKKLGDSVASLQIYLHGTKEEAQGLINTLKSFDTKTSISGLAEIATLVAQKGVAKDEIAGVTQAFDQLFTSLSTSGQSQDVHAGVFEIAKLISIFHDDHEVTPQRVRELGNAFFSLQSTGPVSNEFLQDFAARVGAVRSITGASIPQILGFGAAFQQLGQREEVAGSATSILLTKLIANVDKFAKIAGIVPDKLREIIKINPFEGLLAVAEGIKKSNPAGGVEALVKALGELGVSNVRARGAFSELINNSELFRAKMQQAGSAINDTSGLLTAFQTKQETFSGTIEKIGKEFELVGANQNFQNLVKGIADGLLFIVKLVTSIPFSVVIGGLTAMSAAYLFYKGNLTLARLEQSANNEATLLGYIRLNLMKTGLFGAAAAEQAYAISSAKSVTVTTLRVASLNAEIAAEKSSIIALEAKIALDAEQGVILEGEIAARRAHVVALEGEVIATESATVATEGLNVATKANPLGIILTLIALIIPSLHLFGDESKKVTAAIKEQNTQLQENVKFNNEIAESIQQQTGKTKNSISELISIIESETKNLDLRKRAYLALVSISPDFIGTVDAEYRATDKLIVVYKAYVAQLDKVARAKALQNVNQKIQDDLAEKQSAKFQAKIEADQEAADNKVIAAANQKKLKAVQPGTVFYDAKGVGTQELHHEKSDALKKATAAETKSMNESKAFENYMLGASDEDKKALVAGIQAGLSVGNTDSGGTVTVDQLKAQLADIDKQIAAIDSQKNRSADELAKLKELKAQRSDITKRINDINKANGVTSTSSRGNSDKLEDEYNRKSLDALAKFTQDELKLLQNKYKLEADDQNNSLAQRQAALYKYYAVSKQIIADNIKSQTDALTLEVGQADTKAGKLKDPQKKADALIAIESYKVNKLKEINQDGNVQLEALDKQLFDEREKTFTAEMNTQIANAKAVNKQIQDNPDSTPGEKAKAQTDEDAAILHARVGFFLQMQGLQQVFNQNAKTNWEDFGRILKTGIANQAADTKKVFQALLADIDLTVTQSIDKIKIKFDGLKSKVLSSNQSNSNKNNAISLLDQTQNVETLATQQNGNVGKLLGAQQLYSFGKMTTQQFKAIYDTAVKGQQNLNDAIEGAKTSITSVKGLLGKGLANLFGFAEGSDEAQLMAQTISAAFSTAGDAMNDYFTNEQQRIQQSLTLNEKRLDIELKQAKDRSQSQAESDSLDQQFAAKKLALEKVAFEKNKKIQIEQVKINTVVALSNLAVIALSPGPLNMISAGAFGFIMYGIQSALLLVREALQINQINSAQFAAAKGGRVPGRTNNSSTSTYRTNNNSSTTTTNNNSVNNKFIDEDEDEIKIQNYTSTGGRVHPTAQNIPTQSNGDNILATVKTNEVWLNEDQQRRAGGPSFFKSLGVPGFAGGGAVSLGKDHVDNSIQRTQISTFDILNNKTTTAEEKAITLNRIIYQETLQLLQLNKKLSTESIESKKKEISISQSTSKEVLQSEQKLKFAEAAINKFTKEHDHSFVTTVKESIVKSFEKVSGIFSKTNLTSLNSEVIKTAVSSLIKNTVNEAKNSFFDNKVNDIEKRTEKTATALKKEYVNRISSNKTKDLVNVSNDYANAVRTNQKESIIEKKIVALEKLAVNLHGKIITIKEKVPALFSLLPVSNIQNKYNREIKNINYIIHNAEHGNSFYSETTNNAENKFARPVRHFFSGGKAERLSNGKIIIPQNIPTQTNGDDIFATVKRKEVILNEEQQRRAGGAAFFKALGVPGFTDGGRVMDLRAFAEGGYTGIGSAEIGANLKAPVNPQSYLSGNNSKAAEENNQQIKALTKIVYETGRQVHERIDKMEVVLNPGLVEKANNKTKKATKIGSL